MHSAVVERLQTVVNVKKGAKRNSICIKAQGQSKVENRAIIPTHAIYLALENEIVNSVFQK